MVGVPILHITAAICKDNSIYLLIMLCLFRVGPMQTYICNLLQELGIDVYRQYLEGVNVHDDGRRLSQYTGTIPNISVFSLIDTHLLLGKLDKLTKKIDITGEELCPRAREFDGISLYEFGRRQCYTNQAQSLISVATRMILGYESDQVSLLYFLYYCATAGGTMPLLDSDGGGQDSRMVGGTKRLLNTLRQQLEGYSCSITLNARVINVDYGNKDLVTMRCEDGSIYRARRVVMCCPPSALGRMTFEPTPPPWKLSLWNRSKMGCATKVVVMYDTCFWRASGFSGSCVCEHTNISRPISGVFDYCDDKGDHAALCCFVSGDTGVAFAALSKEQQKNAVISHLVYLLGPEAGADHVIDFYLMDWLHDPDGTAFGGGGCPVDVSPMGFFREHSQQLRRTLQITDSEGIVHEKIYFAGTETALRWVGYMDGAVESALRVAKEILKYFPQTNKISTSPTAGDINTSSNILHENSA